MKFSVSFSTRITTICGLIDASSLSPATKALFPSVDPVFTKRISPLDIFISGDSSYFSRVIYVFLHSMVNLLSTMLVGLKVKTPPASFEIMSFSVYPLNPILPLSLQESPNLRCSQTSALISNNLLYSVIQTEILKYNLKFKVINNMNLHLRSK